MNEKTANKSSWYGTGLAIGGLMLVILSLPIAVEASRKSPVDGGYLTSGVGWRLDPFGSGRQVYHKGYDISVPVGSPVYPVEEGTVFFAGPYGAYGNLVAIDHGNGYVTYYGHNSVLRAQVGERVHTGTVIALSGNTGRSTGPHVHYELRKIPGYQEPEHIVKMRRRLAQPAEGSDKAGRGGVDEAGQMPQDDP